MGCSSYLVDQETPHTLERRKVRLSDDDDDLHNLGSIFVTGPLERIMFSFTFVDQGWGNRKGAVWLRLRRNGSNSDVARVQLGEAQHNATSIRSGFCRSEVTADHFIALSVAGDEIFVSYVNGGGGGHQLTITNLKVQLFIQEHYYIPAAQVSFPPVNATLEATAYYAEAPYDKALPDLTYANNSLTKDPRIPFHALDDTFVAPRNCTIRLTHLSGVAPDGEWCLNNFIAFANGERLSTSADTLYHQWYSETRHTVEIEAPANVTAIAFATQDARRMLVEVVGAINGGAPLKAIPIVHWSNDTHRDGGPLNDIMEHWSYNVVYISGSPSSTFMPWSEIVRLKI